MDLRDRVALVTGGGTGLGRAISHELAGRGAHVGVIYSRSEAEANATAGELRQRGVQAEAFRADVSDGPAARRAVQQALERFGRLDVLINDAGTTKFVPMGDLEGVSDEEWDRIMGVNVKGPWLMARAAAPALKEHKGSIVNISSIAGLWPKGSSLPYCVSKAALNHLTTGLAVAMAPEVRVNGVAPGLFMTRWNAGFTKEQIESMEARTPLRRLVSLEGLARMVVELACNDSITGETVTVDAGLMRS
jgi:3-oxoacyl-[acyl-carrier protein] reductase